MQFNHQTPAQFLARLRERYRTAEREECARLAAWLYDHYLAGYFTVAQIRTSFNLNAQAKWDAFRNKILALRDNWLAIQAAKGE